MHERISVFDVSRKRELSRARASVFFADTRDLSPVIFVANVLSGRSADEICSSFVAAAGPIDVRAPVSGYPSRTSRENVGKNRNGRARGGGR